MYGHILRLDAGRQARVGTNPLSKLLSQETLKKINSKRQRINASAVLNPFAPTLIRPSFYPDYFKATDIRTLYWKVRNHDGLHTLDRVYIDADSKVVFEFTEMTDETPALLDEVLKAYDHFDFVDPKVKTKSVTYTVQEGSYSAREAGEGDG